MLDEEISILSTAESMDSVDERHNDVEDVADILDEKPIRRNSRHRAYVFTAFFDSKDDATQSRQKLAQDILKDCRYAVLGIESCPTTGRVHIQGFALWDNKRSFAALRKVLQTCLGKVPHLEPERATPTSLKNTALKRAMYSKLANALRRPHSKVREMTFTEWWRHAKRVLPARR